MDDTVNMADLPEHVRAEILDKRQKAAEKRSLSPIDPRVYHAHFQTKEQQEVGQKIDELIEQHNLVVAELQKGSHADTRHR